MLGLFLTQSVAPAHAFLGIKLGGDDDEKNTVKGSAGPDGAKNASPQLEKCDKPYGTLAVAEPQDYVGQALLQYGLPSPVGLIRMMIQQSNCFVVVERGRAMKNLMQERELAKSGELRSVPLVGIPDTGPHSDRLILVASNFGQAHHPAWYYNLRKNPYASVKIGGVARSYRAEEVSGAEYDRCWARAVTLYAGYAAYKTRTGGRQIPILVLMPADGG